MPLERAADGTFQFTVVVAGAATHLVADVDGLWWGGSDATGPPPPGLLFQPDGPRRVLDTRDEGAPLLGSRRLVIGGLAADAEAVELHVTALGEGWLSVRPGDRQWTGTSSLNVHHGLSDGSVTVRLSADDAVWLDAPLGLHVIVDVLGQLRAGAGAHYRPAARPIRVLDTRIRSGDRHGGPIGWDERFRIDLSSGPPALAAASLNVTSVGGGGGWSVFWGGGPQPWASVAQHVAGTVAAAAQSAIPVHGGVVQGSSTAVGHHLVVDVYGAFTSTG